MPNIITSEMVNRASDRLYLDYTRRQFFTSAMRSFFSDRLHAVQMGAAPDWTTRLCEDGFRDDGLRDALELKHKVLIERARRTVIDMGVDPFELVECDC